MDLCKATQSYKEPPAHLANVCTVLDMMAVRVTGTTAQPCCLGAAQQAKDTYQVDSCACRCVLVMAHAALGQVACRVRPAWRSDTPVQGILKEYA